jgi:hypothetical protein
MPQEPWKRAYHLKKVASRETRRSAPEPEFNRRSPWPAVVVAFLALALIGGAGWYFYPQLSATYNRLTRSGSTKVITSAQPESSPTAIHSTAATTEKIDVTQLDEGLGIGLSIQGDYKDLLEATKGWEFKWQLTATGGDTLRMTAPGLIVYAKSGVITGWRMDVPAVFAADGWKPWLRDLRKVGIDPKAQDDSSAPRRDLYSDTTAQTAEGWVSPVYELRTAAGRLQQIRAGMKLGVGATGSPASAGSSAH